MKPRHYLTVCHRWQLPVLRASMRRFCGPHVLHVLAWDFEGKSNTPDLHFISRAEFLSRNPKWGALPGPARSPVDTVATMRWRQLYRLIAELREPVTMIDGDSWFWSHDAAIYGEIGGAKMAVSPHRFPAAADKRPGVTVESHRKYGLYNAGWVYVADEGIAFELAERNWEWSYTGFGQAMKRNGQKVDVFGDQGTLEIVADDAGAHVVEHPGLNVGPWNVHRYGLMRAAGVFVVDSSVHEADNMWPLVTYHYSSMRFDPHWRVLQMADAGYAINDHQRRVLYQPYASEVILHGPVVYGDMP